MKEQTRCTLVDYQTDCLFEIYQGERSKSTDNIFLGEFQLNNITLGPRGVKMKIRFDIDANGILHVSAEEPISGQKNNITITNDKGRLTMEQIEKMLEDAQRYKDEDAANKKKVDAYNDLEDYVYVIKAKMKDGNLRTRLVPEDLKKMDDVVEEAMQWLDANKLAEINVIADKKNELAHLCNSIPGLNLKESRKSLIYVHISEYMIGDFALNLI